MNATLELPDAVLEEIAQRAAALVVEQQTSSMPVWLNTADAAAYIAAKPGRVHDLVQLGRLEPRRDGRRLLFKRDELDAYLEASR
jgi:excisionase family DNA binding protein